MPTCLALADWLTGACGRAAGVVGGFAGGERGVQQFIEKGEVSLAEPGGAAPPPALQSPVFLDTDAALGVFDVMPSRRQG